MMSVESETVEESAEIDNVNGNGVDITPEKVLSLPTITEGRSINHRDLAIAHARPALLNYPKDHRRLFLSLLNSSLFYR